MEWVGGFQLIQSAHVDPDAKTILSKIKYDNAAWAKKGGVFGVEFLDSVIHPLLMLADDSAVYYAGGFDAGHFLRQPQTEELYAYLIPDKSRMQIGRKQKIGDFAVYDATGQLCIYIQVRRARGRGSGRAPALRSPRVLSIHSHHFHTTHTHPNTTSRASSPSSAR